MIKLKKIGNNCDDDKYKFYKVFYEDDEQKTRLIFDVSNIYKHKYMDIKLDELNLSIKIHFSSIKYFINDSKNNINIIDNVFGGRDFKTMLLQTYGEKCVYKNCLEFNEIEFHFNTQKDNSGAILSNKTILLKHYAKNISEKHYDTINEFNAKLKKIIDSGLKMEIIYFVDKMYIKNLGEDKIYGLVLTILAIKYYK